MTIIAPHGGKLVNRILEGEERKLWLEKASSLKKIKLNKKQISDVECIATGIFSPLEGFMTAKDYERVVDEMRLDSGLVWSLPITLDIDEELSKTLKKGDAVSLVDENDKLIAILHVEDIYTYDKQREAKQVYKTEDEAHPGVAYLFAQKPYYVGGKISVINLPEHKDFKEYRLTPKQTRELFEKKKWTRVVAFQTRNPIHRAHEYLQKCALETVDGLLIHPLVGETKKGDIPTETRMKCYEEIIKHYYPKDRVALVVFPASMRYAGPREAIFHALCRKNYGCTHFIVGRDHAGVGDYYGTYDAQDIFNEFEEVELQVIPMMFEHSFFCKKCLTMATTKTCPHDKEDHIFLSGTKVREMLTQGKCPPAEFTRKEVANLLLKAANEQK